MVACDEKKCYGCYGDVLRGVTGCVMELCYWALLDVLLGGRLLEVSE